MYSAVAVVIARYFWYMNLAQKPNWSTSWNKEWKQLKNIRAFSYVFWYQTLQKFAESEIDPFGPHLDIYVKLRRRLKCFPLKTSNIKLTHRDDVFVITAFTMSRLDALRYTRSLVREIISDLYANGGWRAPAARIKARGRPLPSVRLIRVASFWRQAQSISSLYDIS